MSTLPGLTSKGEKGKSKFHSLNINHLYKDTLGQSSEKQQQKNTLSLKHGMQSLGKVPSARRPPANLPSIKSEHSGTDTAVSLVPSNGPGWGKQETSTSPSATTTTISNTPTSNTNTTTPQLSAHQAAIALPVTNTIPVPNKVHPTPAVPATGDKSWSAIMAGSDPTAHPPPYQSPQFQHEFPSLSAGDGGVPRQPGTDTQYGPGPSLRPQTEGSWIQGGSRGPPEGAPRTNSGPLVVPPQLSAPAGQPSLPQYRSFVPPFMFRGNTNFPANGHSAPPIAATQPPTVTPAGAGRGRTDARGQKPNDLEQLSQRPIIKEEELSGMDNLTGDMGWALHDDIDYNQKLAFSDDESKSDKDTRKHPHRMFREQDRMDPQSLHDLQNNHGKMWSRNAPSSSQVRAVRNQEEEEIAAQRRLQEEEVANAIKRAKQRKEEEEKKYLEAKQNAAKKLQKLNEKASKSKRDKENDESVGAVNPPSVTPQTISTAPMPGWERDRDIRAKSETDDKPKQIHREGGPSDFRQLTQIEGRSSFSRKDTRGSEKDQNAAPSFSRQFQSNLPPRFLKQQQQLNATSNTQPISFPYDSNSRWMQGGVNKTSPNSRKGRSDSEEKDREEDRFRRHAPLDEGFRSSHRNFSDSGRKSSSDNRYDEYRTDYDFKKDKDEDKRDRSRQENKPESFDSLSISRQNSDEWHSERRIERYDRPQRPDSRDSRASRDSRDSARHSEPRDYTSWPESHCEDTYEEKKKEHRMQVPGPITKEKMEAEDMRSEKRNLTQLKKGIALEKKTSDKREDKTPEKEIDDPWSINRNKDLIDGPRNWADAISPSTVAPENPKFMDVNKSAENLKDIEEEEDKKDKFMDKDRDDKRMHSSSRGRSDSQGSRNQGWGSGNSGGMVYRTSWSNKKGGGAGRAPRGGMRQTMGKGSDWHGTESEGSADDNSTSNDVTSKSPKPVKKFDKDDKEKMKDFKNEKSTMSDRKSEKGHRDFVPRGEPSRHGRGGGGFRGARGGCKRIDGYGPPVKSPFSHHDQEKDKKSDVETNDNISGDDKSKTSSSLAKEGLSAERKIEDRSKGRKPENRRNKARNEGDVSDNSDDASKSKKGLKGPPRQSSQSNRRSGNSTAPPRLATEKRGFGGPSRNDPPHRQNSSGSLRSSQSKEKDNKDAASVTGAIADMSLKNKDDLEGTEVEVEGSLQSDSDGFQEVKSKKTGKTERPKIDEKPKLPTSKAEKDLKNERKSKPTSQLSQQQIANIPSLMATPIKPPANIPQPQNKTQFERPRINKLPPRLAKQREQDRLHKAPQIMGEINDLNKVNQNMYMKEGSGVVAGSMSNAWEKPLTSQLRGNMEQDNIMSVNMESCKPLEQSQVLCQNSATTTEDKTVLDGTKPLNTIIFENTNFKSAPGSRSRNEKPRSNKMEDSMETTSVLQNFNKPMGELLNKNDKSDIQMQLTFNKEDAADMKLDFFETEISHLTEDKSSKNIGLPRTIHNITSSNSTISPSTADALNIKIQSVKKVWESMPTVMEHAGVGQDDAGTFSSSFGPDPNSLDPSGAFSKGTDTPDDNHEVYSPSPNNQNASNSTTNVCKVKPTQQVAGSTGQTVLSTGTHQQHSGMVGPGLMGHPLSPPPMQPVIGGGVGLGQPPQQFTASQHISYQASLGGSTQYGMPAIPSPPNVLYNSTQQLQAQTGLYGAFQIDQSQVMNNQGRSQYSQYSYGLGQTASSPYSQSMYLQTAQPHAPPTAQAPPDLYTNYRIPAAAQFGQNQQLSNPTTVLISSTSNSLMSATVKPSNQQISAIGTKAGGVGQAYQQQAQQGQQLYMTYEPLQANYLQNTGVMQRGPAGPVQNNVVPGLQPSALQASSSYYSGNTGGQAGYFQQPGNSTLQSAQMPQHQAGYGLQGSVFGTHSQSHTSAGMQNYGSPFLSNQIQLAAAMSAQQYRSAALPNTAYMKGVGSQQITDQSGRSQQLKSPGSQQDGLSSVFNSGSQIPSPKSRQNCKQPPPQQSPTAQHKYLYQQTMSSQQTGQARYPTPIQRPVVNFQPSIGAMQQNNGNQKHRNSNNANNRATSRQYYGGQGGNLNNQSDKTEDSKLSDNVVNVPNTSISTSSANIVAKAVVSSVTQSSDKSDTAKEENSTISKD